MVIREIKPLLFPIVSQPVVNETKCHLKQVLRGVIGAERANCCYARTDGQRNLRA